MEKGKTQGLNGDKVDDRTPGGGGSVKGRQRETERVTQKKWQRGRHGVASRDGGGREAEGGGCPQPPLAILLLPGECGDAAKHGEAAKKRDGVFPLALLKSSFLLPSLMKEIVTCDATLRR